MMVLLTALPVALLTDDGLVETALPVALLTNDGLVDSTPSGTSC